MSDRYGYIGIETLLNFCENSKNHAVTPNDFMRMEKVREPERPIGKWMWKLDEGDTGRSMMLVCSICDSGRDEAGEYNFCHICGAKMINPRGEE